MCFMNTMINTFHSIILRDVVGYYNDYKDKSKYDVKYTAKKMNFKLDDDLLDKFYDIFGHTEEKLGLDDLSDFKYESIRGEQYLKTCVSDETYFREGKHNPISDKNTTYICRVLLQIQSV